MERNDAASSPITKTLDSRGELAARRPLRRAVVVVTHVQVSAHKAVIEDADFQGGGAGRLDTGGAVLLGQRLSALSPAHHALGPGLCVRDTTSPMPETMEQG